MSNNNSIIVVGIIPTKPRYSHSSNGEKFYKGVIKTERKSGTYDELSIILSEYFIGEEITGTKIKLKGEVRTHNEDNKLLLSIFVQEIELVEGNDVDEAKINGYICKKSDFRVTSVSNRKIISFILAVNRIYGKTDYIPCICWGKDAKKIFETEIGSNIQLEGRLQSRKYMKDNIEFTTYEMSANKVS